MIPKEVFEHKAMPKLNMSSIALCTLGLQESEFQVYLLLLKKGPKTVNELMKEINKSRATAQRILSQLLSKGIAYRQRKTFLNGGYTYKYYVIPLKDLKEKIKKNLDEWYNKILTLIEKIEIADI